MTRYEILANDLSNMLHEQLRAFENKLLLMEPADILDLAYDYVIKSNLVSAVDNLLDSEQLDEDEIVALINSSLDELYDFYGQGYDVGIAGSYFDCILDCSRKAKEN